MGYIIKPLVTEKMTAITEKQNKFGFIVRPDANKVEIKKEVEALYNVTVTDVNMCLRWQEQEPLYALWPPQGPHQRFQEGHRDPQGRRCY